MRKSARPVRALAAACSLGLVFAVGGCVGWTEIQDTRDRVEIMALASQYAWGVDTLDRALLELELGGALQVDL